MAQDADDQEREARQRPAPEPRQGESRASQGGETDWRDGIEDPRARQFAARFAEPADAARAAFEFRQKLSNAVIRPGRNASQQEQAAFRRAMGVPDRPDGYGIAIPEDLPAGMELDEAARARIGDYLKAMHAAGAPPAAVQAGLDAYFSMTTEAVAAREQRAAETRENTEAELVKEWGGDYPRNAELARRAVHEFGGDRFLRFLDSAEVAGVKLGDHPEVMRAFAAIGRRMGEGSLQMPLPDDDATDARARLDELHALQYSDVQQYKSSAVQNEIQALYRKLHGDEPIVGSDGRTM